MANIIKEPCDDGVIKATPESACCTPAAAPWILAATTIGSGLVFMDGTVVNVALPAIQTELGATVTELQWVVEAYALFLAALILVGGSLGDRYGRRRVFAIGTLIFSIASVWCALATDISQLIAARAVQGIGGALLVPGSLAIISAFFCGERRGKAIGIWSGFTAITAGLGPVVGGWLVDNISWRWAFYINAPLAVVVLVILYWRVPESRDERAARLDIPGAVLVTLGLGALVYGLIESANMGFGHPVVLMALFGGAFTLGIFVFSQTRFQAPMMPLHLFRSRTFSGANLLTLWLYAALGGALYFLPFNLIQVQGYTATEAGAAYLPLILILFLLSRWAGGLVHRHGAKIPLVVGPLIAAVGYVLLARPAVGGSYWATFFPGIVVLGLGMALSVAPLTTVVMEAASQRHAGIASGINNGVSRAAGLMAIAVLGLVLFGTFNARLDQHLAKLTLPAGVTEVLDRERVKLAGAALPDNIGQSVRSKLRRVIEESYVSAFRLIMYIAAVLALASSLTAWLMIETKRGAGDSHTPRQS